MTTPYGPVEPLCDPERDAALAELLTTTELVPLEVELHPHHPHTVLEVIPANCHLFLTRGITSKNKHDDGLLIDLDSFVDRIMSQINPASFNLGHLIPMDMGAPFSAIHPLILTLHASSAAIPMPPLQITLWGETRNLQDPSFTPHRRGRHLRPHPETTWPAPDALDELEWLLRYGTPQQRTAAVETERLMLASVLSAYRSLVVNPTSARQLPALRQAMQQGDTPPIQPRSDRVEE